MGWLHILFNTLNETEIESVAGIRVIGREREVFNYLYSFRNTSLPSNEQRYSDLKISNTHYYKINSVLIHKCFEKLVPAGGMALLEFMKKKGLFTLLRHEIATNEDLYSKLHTPKEKEKFYLSCFRMLIDLPFKYFDEDLVQKFGKLYLENKLNVGEGDRQYVRFHLLLADCNRFAARKNPHKFFKTTEADLLAFEKDLLDNEHYVALYYLYRTFCSYFTFYHNLPEQQLMYMNKAIALKDKIHTFFPINIGQFLNLMYADVLFNCQKPLEAFKIYEKAFKEGVGQDMYGYYYHCENYALLAMVNNEYAKAEKILKTHFEYTVEHNNDVYATRGALAFAKLYLSKDEFKQALKYISIAKKTNEKTFYVPFDMQIRLLENVYFYLKGDHDFALQLANRNLKFLNQQVRKSTLAKEYITFWKGLSSILHALARGGTIPKNTVKVFARLQKNFRYLYANLLKIIVEKIPPKFH